MSTFGFGVATGSLWTWAWVAFTGRDSMVGLALFMLGLGFLAWPHLTRTEQQ